MSASALVSQLAESEVTESGVPESDTGTEQLHQLQDEHAELARSLLSLTTHFAQVQFRLKQIVAADPDDREKMLRSLEEVASHGCPDVRTREESTNLLQLLSEKDYEERLREQKSAQQQLIQQLQVQLQELEQHSIDSQQRAIELQMQFDPELAERQRALIEGLKSRLNINIDIMNEMSMDEVRQSVDSVVHEVTRPARTKEQQIRILASQVEDLERYVLFLKEHSGGIVGNQEVGSTEPGMRTIGKATRNEEVGRGQRQYVPHDLIEDDDEDQVDFGTDEKLLHSGTKRKEFTQKRSRTALRDMATVSVHWVARIMCGIVPTQGTDESRRITCHALCQKVNNAVDSILTLVASEANSSPEDDVHMVTEIHASSPELVRLSRLRLGDALLDVFHFGLVEPLVGTGLVPGWHALSCTVVPGDAINAPSRTRHHIWQVFEQFYALKKGHEYNATPARTLSSAFNMTLDGGVATTPRQRLFDRMMNIQRTHEAAYKAADVKFRSLVCAGMNHGLLAAWCNMIASSEELMERHYQPWACIRTSLQKLIHDLERLSQLTFNLSLDPPAGLAASAEDVVASEPQGGGDSS